MEYSPKIKELMETYIEMYEQENPENSWVQNNNGNYETAKQACDDVYVALHEYSASMQYLGFIEGVNFALDVMNNHSKSTELLKDFLKIAQNNIDEKENLK